MSTQKQDFAARRPQVLFVSGETALSDAMVQLAHLVSWLKQGGWQPTVALSEEGPAADLFRANAIDVVIESQFLLDSEYAALRALISSFDLVVANTIGAYGAVQAAHLETVPVIWYLHEGRVAAPQLQPSLSLADALITSSRVTAEIYQPFTVRPVQVIPYGIPEIRIGLAPAGRPFTFVTLGAFASRNGQDILLEAICDLHPDLRWRVLFQMAGRTLPSEEAFRDDLSAKSESIPNVQLLGPLSHERALDLLNGADVLVCASRDETMPLVLLEAMALGKAIICTKVGDVHEWLRDGINALLVSPENPRELAIAIARCIGDHDLVRALGSAAKKTFYEHFQLDVFGERFAGVLEKTIAHARTKGTSGNYAEWVELYETLGPADRTALRRELDSLGNQPLISIILPVYNPDLDLLSAAIDSVERQIYENWELCIADDASTDPRVRSFLQKLAAGDKRVRLTLREINGHMAACSNSAFALASGEWCALLDQDDMLAEHALAQVALKIESNPDLGLIYSDEDKIDLAGNRSNPFFKNDWNPELFFGQNYVGHLGVYRTDVLRTIGGFREGFEGSQDYDLALRCIERLQSEQISHIPRILYHWRMVSGSLAEKRDAKPYAKEAARRAIADHLQRVGIAARAEACPENVESHRVIYDLPDLAPRVDIIVNSNAGACTEKCIESIRRLTNYPAYEIAVANEQRQLNELATGSNADIVLFLHADIEVIDGDWLREMVSHAARPGVGAVGARLWYPNDTLQHSGYILGLGGVAGLPFRTAPHGHAGFFNRTYLQRNCSAVSSACLATRAAVFRELGGFDSKDLTSNYLDVDFCLRAMEHGLQVVWTPYANLVHYETGSDEQSNGAKQDGAYTRDTAYMQQRWGDILKEDPFYSPNLSLAAPGFGLAFPPRWL